jgi:hypothetical protein
VSKRIGVDIETMPTIDPDIIAELSEPIIAKRDNLLAQVGPPSNWKDEEKIADWWTSTGQKQKAAITFQADDDIDAALRATGLDGAYGRAAVVGIKVEDEAPILIYEPGFAFREPDYERHILARTNAVLTQVCGHHLGHIIYGHNVSFDRTFLRQRGIVNGIHMHRLLTREVKPWENDLVFDTQFAWTGDHRKFVKLDKLCRILGIERKGAELDGEDIDGSKVWDFIQRGEIDKVATYCAGDTERTWQVMNRLMVVLTPQRPNPNPAHVVTGPADFPPLPQTAGFSDATTELAGA